jgi:hypothetical protein
VEVLIAYGTASLARVGDREKIVNSTLARDLSIFSDFFDFGAPLLSLGRAKVKWAKCGDWVMRWF